MIGERVSAPFEANYARGFRLTFDNGWTVSVAWGPGSYSSNYDADFEGYRQKVWDAQTAEVWSWNDQGDSQPGEPRGYLTADEVAKFIAKTAARKKAAPKREDSEAAREKVA